MRLVWIGLLAPSIATADPYFVGGRAGVHSTNEEHASLVGPMLEVETGERVNPWLSLGVFGRFEHYGQEDTMMVSCAEAGPWSTMHCPITTSTTRTNLSAGARARVFVAPNVWLGGTLGVVLESLDQTTNNMTLEAPGTTTASSSSNGAFVEANVGLVWPMRRWDVEVLGELGHSWISWSQNDPIASDPNGDGTWLGLSVGARFH